jgi:hypothetical protein
MVSQHPAPDPDRMSFRMHQGQRPGPPGVTTSGPSLLSGGRPPFSIVIDGADGEKLLVMREQNGRLVVEGDESRWDEAAKRFIYHMCQWAGQFPVRWKDEARRAVEGPQ